VGVLRSPSLPVAGPVGSGPIMMAASLEFKRVVALCSSPALAPPLFPPLALTRFSSGPMAGFPGFKGDVAQFSSSALVSLPPFLLLSLLFFSGRFAYVPFAHPSPTLPSTLLLTCCGRSLHIYLDWNFSKSLVLQVPLLMYLWYVDLDGPAGRPISLRSGGHAAGDALGLVTPAAPPHPH
jgi:hypothetical protein